MTISSEITRINNNIASAYTACNSKGATMPVSQNSANLASTINSITGGGAGVLEQLIEDVIDGDNPVDTSDLEDAEEDIAGIIPFVVSTTKTITANGTYSAVDDNANGYSSVTVNVPTGSVDSGGKYLVQVIDYNGKVLKQDHLNSGATFVLPSNPSHTGLTFQAWSSPVTITNGSITVGNSDITIGALYTTTSELSEFDITLTQVTGLTVNLKLNGTKNWGDGTTDTATSHTYATAGDYTITCNGTTITSSSSSGLFAQGSSAINYYVKEIRLAKITNIPQYSFAYCRALRHISLSNSVTTIDNNVFYYCYALESATIPSQVTTLGNNVFYYNSSLLSLVIPYGVTSLGSSFAYYCTSLANITIPVTVTSLGSSAFQYCYSLTRVFIPSSVTSLGSNLFQYCYSLLYITIDNSSSSIPTYIFTNCYVAIEYNFTNYSSVPTLSNTNAFSGINAGCIIKVPSSLASTWKATNNWSTYANYIIGV